MHRNFKDVIAARPFVFTIGVAGDSGSGKTTFTNAIRRIFGEHLVSTITLDDYHRYDRKERRELKITPLDPEANRLDRLEKDLEALKRGEAIVKPVYNHLDGTFGPEEVFRPTKILILEGLHTLFTPRLRELLDFKLFVDPEPGVKREWKIKRDIERRGYRYEEVLNELAERERDYQKFIAPQCRYADAVVRASFSKYGRELGGSLNIYQVTLSQRRLDRAIRNVGLSIDLLSLLSLSERTFIMEYCVEELDGKEMGSLTFDGELTHEIVRALERSVEQQTGVHPIDIYQNRHYVTATEIVQLIIAWRIINQRIFLEE
ncbi:MAG: phosphoribulokinase [Methanomicrobiales archaeon]|nr:phosphoribulokinase [Methanomicrobiales archaeon]